MKYLLLISLLLFQSGCSFLTDSKSDDYPIPEYNQFEKPDKNSIRIRLNEIYKNRFFNENPTSEQFPCEIDTYNKSFMSCEVDLHGNGTLYAKRKNFDIKLSYNDSININNKFTKRFRLLSLTSDKGYINNLIGYTLCKDLNLFFSEFHLTELYVNNDYYGIYLFIEDVEESLKRSFPNIEFIIRRRNNNDLDLKYYKSKDSIKAVSASDYMNKYKQIYLFSDQENGSNLLNSIKEHFNLDSYCKLLSINSLLENGDYTDELFVYGYPLKNNNIIKPYFNPCTWDFDDLFSAPHGNNSFPEDLIYCSENSLDRDIYYDKFLYEYYKCQMLNLLSNTITTEKIDTLFSTITQKLEFFLSKDKVLSVENNLSTNKISTWNDYKSYYEELRIRILKRREYLLNNLK